MAESPSTSQFERLLSIGSSIIAPATVLTTLLFYFGYVSSRAQFDYFGVDVDTIGLSTQDYAMRSPQALLVPLLTITLGGAVLLLLDKAIQRNDQRAQRFAGPALIVGSLSLASGLALIFSYALVGDWRGYPLLTPLVLATGVVLTGYTLRLRGMPVRGAPLVLGFAVVAICLFWATATVAQWTGRGVAKNTARHLDRLPVVILDTKERLFLRSPGVEESALPATDGQVFRFRYRHLRLLIEGKDRMFLVPDVWSASDSTLVVPFNGDVRVQFQFVNDPP
jgi:hypothetical protein